MKNDIETCIKISKNCIKSVDEDERALKTKNILKTSSEIECGLLTYFLLSLKLGNSLPNCWWVENYNFFLLI